MAENEYVVSALVRKRAELAGRIDAAEDGIAALYRDIDHIDATLRMFAPDVDLDAIKPRRPRREKAYFKHGQLTRLVLSAIREHAPLANDGVTRHVMQVLGMDCDDVALFSDIARRVSYALRDQRKLGRVVSEQGAGRSLIWRIRR